MKQIFLLSFAAAIFFFSCKKDWVNQPAGNRYTLSTDSLKMLQTDIPYDTYNDLVFVNTSTGYAVSRNGRIVKTSDGGHHWTDLSSGVNFYMKRVQFLNSQEGFVIGGDSTGGYLMKTVNAGQSWQVLDLHMPEPGWPTGIFFLNTNTGFITGKHFFKKTTDGGVTWTNVIEREPGNFTDVSFKTNKEGFATAEAGKYYQTADGGVTWQVKQSDIDQVLTEICHSSSKSFALSGFNLIDLQTGRLVTSKIPAGVKRLLFLNDINSVGAGQHFEEGFWPYGDIHLTNSSWDSTRKKTYRPLTEALDFTALAKRQDGKVIIIGAALQSTPVVELNY